MENALDGTPYAADVRHLPVGPASFLRYGNGHELTQAFNYRLEPLAIASSPLSLDYTPSPAGDVAGIDDGVTPRTFRYDHLDRLVESPGWLAYGYDGNGNRTSETVEGASLVYAYTRDRVTKATPAGTTVAKSASRTCIGRGPFAYDLQTPSG